MANRITYDTTKPWGGQLAALAGHIAQVQQLSQRMVTAMNAMSAGGAGPFVQLETEFGLVPGTGSALYTLVNNARVNAAVIDIAEVDLGTSP